MFPLVPPGALWTLV